MAAKEASWLSENFEMIEHEGGPDAVKFKLEECNGRDAKIAFLQAFDGIGPKYARNMLMEVYHPDFRSSIAVDERIKKVSRALGVTFRTYADEERFYLDVAESVKLNGWELDRLLYNFTDEVLAAL
jgi:endonuclease III